MNKFPLFALAAILAMPAYADVDPTAHDDEDLEEAVDEEQSAAPANDTERELCDAENGTWSAKDKDCLFADGRCMSAEPPRGYPNRVVLPKGHAQCCARFGCNGSSAEAPKAVASKTVKASAGSAGNVTVNSTATSTSELVVKNDEALGKHWGEILKLAKAYCRHHAEDAYCGGNGTAPKAAPDPSASTPAAPPKVENPSTEDGEQLNAVIDKYEALRAEHEAMKADIKANATAIAEIKALEAFGDRQAVEELIRQKYAEMAGRHASLEGRVAVLEDRVDGLESLKGDIKGLDDRLGPVEKQLLRVSGIAPYACGGLHGIGVLQSDVPHPGQARLLRGNFGLGAVPSLCGGVDTRFAVYGVPLKIRTGAFGRGMFFTYLETSTDPQGNPLMLNGDFAELGGEILVGNDWFQGGMYFSVTGRRSNSAPHTGELIAIAPGAGFIARTTVPLSDYFALAIPVRLGGGYDFIGTTYDKGTLGRSEYTWEGWMAGFSVGLELEARKSFTTERNAANLFTDEDDKENATDASVTE